MKKKINNLFTIFIIFLFGLLFIKNAIANENIDFLSLKNNEVNVRVGPSKNYPIKFIYKKKYLPLKILDKVETWKKIKDFENNSGWIHISQLSKKKTAINVKANELLYKKPTIYSKPIAKLEFGRLVLIKKCKNKWCKIKTGKFNGWIFKKSLWGNIK